MKPQKLLKRYMLMLILVCVVFFAGYLLPPGLHAGLSIGALVGFLMWIHRNWRCPDCGKSLGRARIASDIICPNCGKKHKMM